MSAISPPITPPLIPQQNGAPINGTQALDPTAPQQPALTTPPPINGPQVPLTQDPAATQQQGPITPPSSPGPGGTPTFGKGIKNGPPKDQFELSNKA